jgi:hypothetical protein
MTLNDDHAAAAALTHAFFAGLDHNEPDAVAACMAAEGVWMRQGTPLIGPDAVRAACAARPKDRATAHVITNLSVRTDGPDRLKVRFYLLAYLSARQAGAWTAPTLAPLRECEDTLVRTAGGLRILHKDSRQLMPPA